MSRRDPISIPRNILMIMTDQQSADAMSHVIGRTHLQTPAMDRIAVSGLRFNQAYCAHPLCVPSRTSMFTGRYPHETGVLTNNDLRRDVRAFPCIGRILAEAGYDTGYVGKWHFSYPVHDVAAHGFRFLANTIDNGADIANAAKAAEFLQEDRRGPFFLVVSGNNPHNICEWARGDRGNLPDGVIGDIPPLACLPPCKPNHQPPQGEPDAVALLRQAYHASPTFPVGGFGKREWREYQWAYYRMIEHADRNIARVLEALSATGQHERTAIVFLSDHGDAQGAHGWNQKTVLHDESSRVPCLVSCPGRISPAVSNALIQTGVDLMPTLCDLADVVPPAGLPGASMLDTAAHAAKGEGHERPYVVSQTRFVQGAAIHGVIPDIEGRMVRSPRFKYCVYSQGVHRESLVDMQSDPGETVNLAHDKAYHPVLEQHRRWLKEFSIRFCDPFPMVAITAQGAG